MDEGFLLHDFIRDRKLTTYTSTQCLSACTISFLAGIKRYLADNARLGFHSARIGSLDRHQLPEINDNIKRLFISHGVSKWFIEKAFSTSSNDVWYPTNAELLNTGVVDELVDLNQFGLSGFGGLEKLADTDKIS